MKLLLDTHTLVWAVLAPDRLSGRARAAISDGQAAVFVSAVSAMEIATKVRLGRFDEARPLAVGFGDQLVADGFELLPITVDHAERAGRMAGTHEDPWDRLLVAQAWIEGMVLVSRDDQIGALGAPTYW